MVGDSFENVASLQDCHFQQRDSVQTLGKILSMKVNVHREAKCSQENNHTGRKTTASVI